MKKISLFLIFMYVIGICVGCIKNDNLKESKVLIKDMTGREIEIDTPVKKVVALTASDCEILCTLGKIDTLVGRGTYCDYPKEVKDIQSVQSGENTNIEQIVLLKPDVILMSTMAQSKDQIKSFEDVGIKVVVTDAKDIKGVYKSIKLIGSVVGRDKEALNVIADMKSKFDKIKEKSSNTNTAKKKIYFEVSPLEQGIWTAGNNTFMNEIVEMMGCENIFKDVDGWVNVSEEQIIERNPDYIVTISMYSGKGITPVDEIKSRKNWQSINALKNNKILSADSNEISRPCPRIAHAAEILYEFVNN